MNDKVENLLRVLKDESEKRSDSLTASSMASSSFERGIISRIKQSKSASFLDFPLENAQSFIWQLCAASLVLTFGLQAYLGSMSEVASADVYSSTFMTADADYLMGSN